MIACIKTNMKAIIVALYILCIPSSSSLSTDQQSCHNDYFMIILWLFYDNFMINLWLFYDNFMIILWLFYDYYVQYQKLWLSEGGGSPKPGTHTHLLYCAMICYAMCKRTGSFIFFSLFLPLILVPCFRSLHLSYPLLFTNFFFTFLPFNLSPYYFNLLLIQSHCTIGYEEIIIEATPYGASKPVKVILLFHIITPKSYSY
jgi:hypothetical protein